MARPARLPHGAVRVKTLEDTPFYTRSEIQLASGHFMHESLDLRRFCRPGFSFCCRSGCRESAEAVGPTPWAPMAISSRYFITIKRSLNGKLVGRRRR